MLDFGEQAMTRRELEDFLVGTERFEPDDVLYAAISTLRRNGAPFVIPMGFWYDGDHLFFTVTPGRSLSARLRRDPRVSVTIFNHAFPAKFAIFEGVAEEMPGPDHALALRIHHRYPKSHVANEEAFDEVWLSPGRIIWRVAVTDRVAVDASKSVDIVASAILPFERNTAGQP